MDTFESFINQIARKFDVSQIKRQHLAICKGSRWLGNKGRIDSIVCYHDVTWASNTIDNTIGAVATQPM